MRRYSLLAVTMTATNSLRAIIIIIIVTNMIMINQSPTPSFHRFIPQALKFAFQELQPLIAQDVDEFTRDFLSAADMTMRFDVS